MGNKICCDENREQNNQSLNNEAIEEVKKDITDINQKNVSKENENEIEKNENIYNLDNNISKENYIDEIHNLKSSIFDNDNENENENENDYNDIDKDNFNFEENDINNNFKPLTSQRKLKFDTNNDSGYGSFISEKYYLKNENKKKEKSKFQNNNIVSSSNNNNNHNNNKNHNMKEIKKVIENNPNYKNTPLELTDYNNDKENEFYLINTSHYIGIKNSNNNLILMKNDKDIIINSQRNVEIGKNKNANNAQMRGNNNINYNISNTQKTTSVNPNIIVTNVSHNIPYGEKLSEKNNTIASKKEKEKEINNKNIIDSVNKYNVVENIHNNNSKIIEIYIKNQIRKIINNYKNKKSNKNQPILYYPNIQNKIKSNGTNNTEIKIKNFNNLEKNINDISHDILNSGNCKTILNKEKNFCIKYFDNGSIYIGQIKNNKCNGIGKYITSKGNITKGFFNDNFLDGYEIIERMRNNSVYEGYIEKNKFNGYGIEIFEDGTTYLGKYENNEKSGIGTYDWGDGSQYQGNWKNGLPDGLGIFSDSKNRIYEGEWKNGKMNGIGLFKWGDGRKYIGYYKDDKRNGFGIFFWSNPFKIYMGFWLNGLQNGLGKVYTSFKEKYCLWEDGKMIKKLSNKKEYDSKIKKYLSYFKMTTDDLLTFFLDL